MNKITFKKIQQNLTAVALVSGVVAVVVAVDSFNLIAENDFSAFGFAVSPWIVGAGFAVSAFAVVAKLLAYSRR
jgi:hypothetical protein